MNRRVIGLALLAFAFVLPRCVPGIQHRANCGRGASFASPGQVVTVESSDEQLLLISGSDPQEVEAAVNEAAVRGFKLVRVSETLVDGYSTGLICLLERCETPNQPAQAYAFVQGLEWNKLSKKVNDFARRGYRVLPWSVRMRNLPPIIPGGGRSKVLIVMEQKTLSEISEYKLIVSLSPERLINKLLRQCEQGYRAIALLDLWAGQAEVVLERPALTGGPIDPDACDAERYEVIHGVPTDSSRDPLSALDSLLIELSSRHYRLLASTTYLSSISKPRFRGWALFERAEHTAGKYKYIFVEPRDSMEEAMAAIEEVATAGFRLHPLSLPGLIMEKEPDTDTKSEYLRAGPGKLTELLDAIAAAYGDGFRVVRIWIDSRPERQNAEPEVNVLLERHCAEPKVVVPDQRD